MRTLIGFVTYETPGFPCGGVTAVMRYLPAAVQEVADASVLLITPFHNSEHPRNQFPGWPMTPIGSVPVPYHTGWLQVVVHRHVQQVPWYVLQPREVPPGEPAFFKGRRHPYDLGGMTLMRDALFFGASVVQALPLIADDILRQLQMESRMAEVAWRLVMQDWEAATTALAVASQGLPNVRLHLTLHNSYDAFVPATDGLSVDGALERPGLRRVGIIPERCPGDTVLDRAFSLVQWPVFTVSEQFAMEFTHDLLQRQVIAPQLQHTLAQRPLLGVDNGPFRALAVPRELLNRAAIGDIALLQGWKATHRARAMEALAAHTATTEEPIWGDPATFRQGGAPWFVMAGRDDPRQKGYDVAGAAVAAYLQQARHGEERAQFLFFPIPGDEDMQGLWFLKALAEQYPEDVLVFPFPWLAGFSTALRGATYALMPSLYEPFGMANELYLDGVCVGIARATGGNVEQIVPLWAARACSTAVRIRAQRYHAMSAHPTGILFRERDDLPSAWADWQAINAARYNKAGGEPSRVEERRQYTLFAEMARELELALADGIRVYTQAPELYYRMLAEGIAHIQRTFSWQRAAQEYARYLR